MTSESWLHVLRDAYLADFIADGGSCVKIITAEPSLLRGKLSVALSELAVSQKYRYIPLVSANTKLHLIDKLFHGVTAALNWPAQAMCFLETQLHGAGYRVDHGGSHLDLTSVSAKNGLAPATFAKELQVLLKTAIIDDFDMSIEFRYAVLHLCLSRIYRDGKPFSDLETTIVGWLTGDVSSIVDLRKASIFQRIGRHNGRHLLYSLTKWLRKCGSNGIILTLDISRYLETVKTADRRDGFYYTPANTSDLYEILRECIDDIDKATGIVILVLATPAFLSDDRRGVNVYQALKMRVWDDVWVRGHENPVAPLVRLTA